MQRGRRTSRAAEHRLDEPSGLSLSMVAVMFQSLSATPDEMIEIAEISEANRTQMHRRDGGAAADQERRLQRLQEILDELMTLTDWKKT